MPLKYPEQQDHKDVTDQTTVMLTLSNPAQAKVMLATVRKQPDDKITLY